MDQGANIPAVMTEPKALLPDYNIYMMEEFTSLFTVENVQGGALRSFIDVMIGIGVVIGFAVVLLSMYMAVLQRTREIGILKALGASRWFILKVILAEAIVMGLAGAVLGIGMSFAARALISAIYPASLTQAIAPDWWPIAAGISLAGVILGALYPGLSAAGQDPIEALALRVSRSSKFAALRKVYRVGKVDVQALRGVDLDVAAGEFLAIVGPSGSGKSTLFHIIGGLTPATAGRVRIGGQDISSLSDAGRTELRKKSVGFVFQKFNLLPNST